MRSVLLEIFAKGDKILLICCMLASGFGLLLLNSATNWMSEELQQTMMSVQMAATFIGICLYLLFSMIDFRAVLEKYWKAVIVFNVGFLALLKTPLGTTNNSGNLNWLQLPFLPVDIQPNEMIKISYILVAAYIMSKVQEDRRNISTIPALVPIGVHALLTIGLMAYICRDWGMVVIYCCVTVIMLWSAGLSVWIFGAVFSAIALVVHVVWTYFLPFRADWDSNYLIMRFRVLLDHSLDPTGVGWHQTRSLLALGSGKVFGQGYMEGIQSQSPVSSSLPARHTDFIFSVCGEELGLVGCLFLLGLLFMIIFRCVWISRHVDNYFSAYVAMGGAGMLLAQVFFNVGMCLYIMPTMGLTLPFISYGGSSIVTMYASMGIVASLRARALPSWLRDRGQLQF